MPGTPIYQGCLKGSLDSSASLTAADSSGRIEFREDIHFSNYIHLGPFGYFNQDMGYDFLH